MMARYIREPRVTWQLDVRTETLDATCGVDTIDPNWRGRDSQGHVHRYDRQSFSYPTLQHVVESSHWCDGTEGWTPHEPHEVVDEGHYECLTCGEVVKPGIIPAHTPQYVPGSITATLQGVTSRGTYVVINLPRRDYLLLVWQREAHPERLERVIQRMLDEATAESGLIQEQLWS